jgi:tRNA(Ile)-lysidine synthase
MGLEETARALRYTFLYQLARELKADRIATAHNANDNAETLLMHLLRGTALQGLGGIEPRLNALVRPLLTTSREKSKII